MELRGSYAKIRWQSTNKAIRNLATNWSEKLRDAEEEVETRY